MFVCSVLATLFGLDACVRTADTHEHAPVLKYWWPAGCDQPFLMHFAVSCALGRQPVACMQLHGAVLDELRSNQIVGDEELVAECRQDYLYLL